IFAHRIALPGAPWCHSIRVHTRITRSGRTLVERRGDAGGAAVDLEPFDVSGRNVVDVEGAGLHAIRYCLVARRRTGPPARAAPSRTRPLPWRGPMTIRCRALLTALTLLVAWPAASPAQTGDINTHDPAIIRAGDVYYLFHTG